MRRREFLDLGLATAFGLGLVGPTGSSPRAIAADDDASDKAARPSRLKIGQIGTGHSHAGGKLAAIRSLNERWELVGVVEPDAARKARAEKSDIYSGVAWLAEAALLAMPEVKAVAIETAIPELCAAASRAIAAGKNIHLDKPGSLEHGEFAKMRRAAEKLGLTVQMGYMLRYNPAFTLLFRAAKEGWFGEILEIDCAMGKLAPQGMRKELAGIAGGGMFELACHVIDAVVTVLGKPVKVTAIAKQSSPTVDTFADDQLAVLEYAKATVTVRCNHADPFGGPHRRFQVVGTKGAMEITPLESGRCKLMLSEPHEAYKKGEQTLALEVPKGRYDEEFIDLARVVGGEKQFAWSADHDIAVHETVLRAAGVMS
jgi:predicted dehydrogenase